MGAIASCCCGRREHKGEKEPLLPRHTPPKDALPRRDQIKQVASVLAALSEGKIPSQDQINSAVKALQRNVLETRSSLNPENGYRGPLSARGRVVLDDVREACQALLQFGIEKNYDDVVQEFWYHVAHVDDAVRVPSNPKFKGKVNDAEEVFKRNAPGMTSVEEVNSDIDDTVSALRTLASLVLTSSAFRLILSDVLLTSREIVADFAANVSNVAGIVQNQATEVDEIVRPAPSDAEGPEGVDTLDTEAVKNKAEDVKDAVQDVPHQLATGVDGTTAIVPETAERLRTALVERVQAIVVSAQSDPAYESALITIFEVIHKYVDRATQLSIAAKKAVDASGATGSRVDSIADVAPVTIEMDPEASLAMATIRKLLNRFGSGVDPMMRNWEALLHHTYADPGELENYLSALSAWLRKAIRTPQWVNEDEASKELNQLYDRGQAMLDLDPELKGILNALLGDADGYLTAIKNDKSINRLLEAFARLSQHGKDLGLTGARVAIGQQDALREVRRELWNDLLGWLLPRLLRAIKAIPIPRVEYTSEMLDLVIDDLVLEAPSFVPDHVFIENSNTVHVLASEALDEAVAIGEAPRHRREARHGTFDSQMTVASNLRLKIDGLRLSARLISYFVDVKYWSFLGWRDNGLLSFDIGAEADPRLEVEQGVSSEGVSIDLDLRTAPPDAQSFYKVENVSVDIPGLTFGISKSRHWLINALLRPFIGPVGRRVGRSIAAEQVKQVLTSGDEMLFKVHERAVQNTMLEAHNTANESTTEQGSITPSLSSYWTAFTEIREEQAAKAQAKAQAIAEDDPTTTESEIHPTTKGIVRTTRVEGPTGEVEDETAIAIGVGPQLLPGRGGPDTTDEGRGMDVVAEEGQEALEDIQEVAEETQEVLAEVTNEGLDAARAAKSELSDGAETYERRKNKEKQKDGWRSKAFDL